MVIASRYRLGVSKADLARFHIVIYEDCWLDSMLGFIGHEADFGEAFKKQFGMRPGKCRRAYPQTAT